MPGLNKNLVSPLDHRYNDECHDLISDCFSEEAHISACFDIELSYWQFIVKLLTGTDVDTDKFDDSLLPKYHEIAKQYEKVFGHDIKSIEWAVRDYITHNRETEELTQFVHYGLTSQDIVSYSVNRRLYAAIYNYIIPEIELVWQKLEQFSTMDNFIYCRTHGQKGNITTFMTEMAKYRNRIYTEFRKFEKLKWYCKFSGSTGDYTTFSILHPGIDIRFEMNKFMMKATHDKIKCHQYATQTDNWKSLCDAFNILREISNILIDLSRDLWMYHMNGDIKQKNLNKAQVGSSVMPQKVNPITIENAEGNLEMCEMWFTFFTSKLSKSRLQRDLSDSVVIRNVGVPVCNLHLALWNICRELDNIEVIGITNMDYSVFGELVQTKLRFLGELEAYERTKAIFRTGVPMTAPKFFDACKELFGENDWSDIHKYVTDITS